MELSDAHFHFNMKCEDPVQDMFRVIGECHLKEVVLILNSDDEFEMYRDHVMQLADCRAEIHAAVLLDIHNLDSFYAKIRWLQECQYVYSVKLHPRLSNIQKKDFETIVSVLKETDFKNIIIDAFYYGSRLENLIFDELSIFLAEKFQTKKIIMAHFGGIKILETMLRTRKVPNIYYDISFTINYLCHTSVWMDIFHCLNMNQNRVMFGSDYPECTESQALKNLVKLLAQFGGSEEMYKKLTVENVHKIYFEEETGKVG